MHTFTSTLLQWYAANKRQLPWREERDPYRIWVSEVILQQTRVRQGWDYYLRFVARFPDVRSLAEASEQEVLKYWQGLGYYSRARNLHAGARYLVESYQGAFPNKYEEILKIKGVGEYTAAAIASFAFGLPHAVVDGNVLRVVARFFGITEAVDGTEGRKRVKEMVQWLIPTEQPADFNQAIMDFGALQCVPAHPHCDGCPMQAGCEAFANQLQELLPVKRQKVKQRERYFYYWVLRWQDCVYLHRRAEGDIWQGLYEFPLTASDNPMEENRLQEALSAMLRLEVPLCFENASPCYKHVLTHQIIHARFFVVDLPVEVNMPDCIMVKKGNLWRYPVAKLMDRFINSSKGNAFL